MAITRVSIAVVLAFLLCMVLVASAEAVDFTAVMTGSRAQATQINCKGKCGYRCSKSSRAKLCFKDCCACCKKCNCVPPGTAGNREMCPCYANLKNSKGTGKCP